MEEQSLSKTNWSWWFLEGPGMEVTYISVYISFLTWITNESIVDVASEKACWPVAHVLQSYPIDNSHAGYRRFQQLARGIQNRKHST